MGELTLTLSELEAKTYIIHILKNASSKPCDIGDGSDLSTMLPGWYDEEKYKRGQKYFFNNRYGMLFSNLCGLYTLMAHPRGLDILDSTDKSNTSETAKKRYVSTIIHMLSWYELDLHPDSKSWTSLDRVRKMHLNASNSAGKKKLGNITQFEVALTTFGFMGFALIRPHLLGIRYDNKEDRESFIHFWAVMGHMLGVDDEFNMCLFEIETVEHICLIMLRYIFIPLIQLETLKFQVMMKALLDGMSPFLPNMTYDLQMFALKRIMGVPGYQYSVDLSKEKICRQILSIEEIIDASNVTSDLFGSTNKENSSSTKIGGILFTDGIPILIPNNDVYIDLLNRKAAQTGSTIFDNKLYADTENSFTIGDKKFLFIMRSKDNVDWTSYLNDSKFYALSKMNQFVIRWRCLILKMCENVVGKYLNELGLSALLYIIRRYYKSNIDRKRL